VQLPEIASHIVLAPMAGGVGTPALVSAVGEAGGLGFLAAGYLTAERLREDIVTVRERSQAPYAVNIFVPNKPSRERTRLAEDYAAALGAWLGDPDRLGQPRYTDDEYDAKVDLVTELRPDLVSFTFGVPDSTVVYALHDVGVPVAVTVTTVREAEAAAAAGADALVLQGWEAGAHRGSFDDTDDEQLGLLPLLRLVSDRSDLPLLAGGGLADGAAVAAVLAAGATAAMLGTAFMRCPEAGTSGPHLDALSQGRNTVVTRAFTGRRARGLDNEMIRAMEPSAPSAYPEVNYVTAPLRAEARTSGDTEHLHLWAGQAHALSREMPAGELVVRLVGEARDAADRLARLTQAWASGA
jgi:nitronate monooxygenase